MSADRVAAGTTALPADGSPVPARLRIAAWITLATAVGLLAVVLTIRSALLAGVDRDADAGIRQELDEFRTFVAEGRDPETGELFTAGSPVLQLYLQRQFPATGEVLLGWDATAADDEAAAVVQEVPETYGLTDDPGLLRGLALGEATAGTDVIDGRTYRWGRTVVQDTEGRPSAVLVVATVLEPAQQQAAETVRLVVLVCLGGLVLTAGFAVAVAGVILAPVRAVRRAAAGITRTDLGRRIQVQGRDDVAALATTFNAMLDRLESSSRAQHRVVRVARRDLEAPLAVVRDPAATVADRERAATEVTSTLGSLSLLTASQLPAFADLRELRADDLGRTLLDEARRAAPDGPGWSGRLDADGSVVADPDLLRAAVAALARNAAAEHLGPAALRLGTSGDADAIEVWVEDDGPGLDEARALHVLDRYTDPAHGAGDEPDAESGLGLAVVRAVADAHEGEAWVETEPGAGARFGLRVPRHPPAPPTHPEE